MTLGDLVDQRHQHPQRPLIAGFERLFFERAFDRQKPADIVGPGDARPLANALGVGLDDHFLAVDVSGDHDGRGAEGDVRLEFEQLSAGGFHGRELQILLDRLAESLDFQVVQRLGFDQGLALAVDGANDRMTVPDLGVLEVERIPRLIDRVAAGRRLVVAWRGPIIGLSTGGKQQRHGGGAANHDLPVPARA